MMNDVLRGTESFAGVYLDDIVIYSKSWKEHLEHLSEVLNCFEETGLTVDVYFLDYRLYLPWIPH